MTIYSSLNRSLRRKLYSGEDCLISSKNPTKIIILKDDLDSVPEVPEVINSMAVKESWHKIYDLSDLNTLGLVPFYQILLAELHANIAKIMTTSVVEQVRLALRRTLSSSALGGKSIVVPRTLRKRILRRLVSLLGDLEPVHEIFSNSAVHRIVFAGKPNIRVHSKNQQVSSLSLFFCDEEAKLFVAYLGEKIPQGNQSILLRTLQRDTSFIIESIHTGTLQESAVIVKRLAASGVTLLDLIRRKVMSPNLARSISRIARESSGGMFIFGAQASGKTCFLSALLSTLSVQRVPLLIDYSGEVMSSHPNLHLLSKTELERCIEAGAMDDLVDRIMSLGITDVFVDGVSRLSFAFLSRAVARYPLQICATSRGYDLEGIFSTLSNEHYLDSESFSNIFPLAIYLEEDIDGSYVSRVLEANGNVNQANFVTLIQCDKDTRSWHLLDNATARAAYFDSIVAQAT